MPARHIAAAVRTMRQAGLSRLQDRRVAGGLNLLEAVVTHYTAHHIEIEVGARVVVSEDAFEIAG